MNLLQIYSCTFAGFFALLLCIRSLPRMRSFFRFISLFISKHITYRLVLRRHRFAGPWTYADVLIQLGYLAVNLFLVGFQATSLEQAGRQAGTVASINMIPVFLGFHLSFVADLLGVSLWTCRRIHRSTGTVAFVLSLLHTMISLGSNRSYPLRVTANLYGLIGSSSVGLLIVLSVSFLRELSYELFLRIHQSLALLYLYAMWRHSKSASLLSRLCVYVPAALLSLTSCFQLYCVLYQNGFFWRGFPRALVTKSGKALKIRLTTKSKVRFEEGQYLNLWIPAVSVTSFLQSHPFMVASCQEGEQTSINLLVEPRSGFSSELLHHAKVESQTTSADLRLALFTGPHGAPVAMGEFGTVFMIAWDLVGIIAHLPHLRRLIRGFNESKVRTRRVHLAWQLAHIDDGAPARDLLNQALREDTFDNGYIICVSIFYRSGYVDPKKVDEGDHRRIRVMQGSVDLEDELCAEAAGRFSMSNPDSSDKLETVSPKAAERGSGMLVTVSAPPEVRDHLKQVVRGHVDKNVSLLELDYQPT